MPIQVADKWSVLDFHSGDIPEGVITFLKNTTPDYKDEVREEDLYSPRLLEDYTEGALKLMLKAPNDLNVLKEICQLCEQHDAFYFRIID